MAKLLIVRKSAEKARKLTKTQMTEALEALASRQRVARTELVEFLLTAEVNKLPVVPQSVIDKAQANRDDRLVGWEIPVSNLGRVGQATVSSRESVRLWIKQNLGDYIDPDMLAVVLVD